MKNRESRYRNAAQRGLSPERLQHMEPRLSSRKEGPADEGILPENLAERSTRLVAVHNLDTLLHFPTSKAGAIWHDIEELFHS